MDGGRIDDILIPPGLNPQYGTPPLTKETKKRGHLHRKSLHDGDLHLSPQVSTKFILTAYLPQQDWKKIEIECTPGKALQDILEEALPELHDVPYNVFQFPIRSLLNVQRSCDSLNGHEITIELNDVDTNSSDKRLAVTKELLRTEDVFLSNVQLLIENYCEPLRKWGIGGTPLSVLFDILCDLRDILITFYTKVEIAVRHWNSEESKIGYLFSQYVHMLLEYDKYYHKHPEGVKYLKHRRETDSPFMAFIESRRGAERHTLESLLQLPIVRIWEYDKLLVQLLTVTPEHHVDYPLLKSASDSLHYMVQSRECLLKVTENEKKLLQVQSHFPHDSLHLNEPMELLHVPAAKRHKFSSNSPSVVQKTSRSKSLPKTVCDISNSPSPDLQKIVLKRGVRMYIHEGPTTFISIPNFEHRQRYLFLFEDLLIIGKPSGKSRHRTFRLKHWVPLVDMWLSDRPKNITDMDMPKDTAFIIGWPTCNYLATFDSPQEKRIWFSLLNSQIKTQQETMELKGLPIHVVNCTEDDNNLTNVVPEPLMTSCEETADDILKNALKHYKIKESPSNFYLCVKSSKDDSPPLGLMGHEHPFSILLQHISEQLHRSGDSSVQNAPIQFLVKRKATGGEYSDGSFPGRSKSKNLIKTSNLLHWYKGRKGPKPGGRRQRGGPEVGRYFGQPLDNLSEDGQLPEFLQLILRHLYLDGPSFHGIFRKPANHARKMKLKASIDMGQPFDVLDLPANLVGALLTEFLRNIPSSLFQRYTEFVATNDITDPDARIGAIQKVISRLPAINQAIMTQVFTVLYHIAENQKENEMNATNLAICLAPTLLWPDTGFGVIRNEVPPLIIFMIENTKKIFGDKVPELFDEGETPGESPKPLRVPVKWDNDEPHQPPGFLGYDDGESEEGALSDSQAYKDVKLSPRKPHSGSRRLFDWPQNPKPDSESPDLSDDESTRPSKAITTDPTSPKWAPARPRIKMRNGEGGRERKERRRTIGGIIDGDLLVLNDQVGSDNREMTMVPDMSGVQGDSENTLEKPYPNSNQKKRMAESNSKNGRRRQSRGRSSNLGGLAGKGLVGSVEDFVSLDKTLVAAKMGVFSHSGLDVNMSDSYSESGKSLDSSSSLEATSGAEKKNKEESTGQKAKKQSRTHRKWSFKSAQKPRKRRRGAVKRASSLRNPNENYSSEGRPPSSGGDYYSSLDRKCYSLQNVYKQKEHSPENILKELAALSKKEKERSTAYSKANERGAKENLSPRHLSGTSQDEGIGGSISATPASTLSRDSRDQPYLSNGPPLSDNHNHLRSEGSPKTQARNIIRSTLENKLTETNKLPSPLTPKFETKSVKVVDRLKMWEQAVHSPTVPNGAGKTGATSEWTFYPSSSNKGQTRQESFGVTTSYNNVPLSLKYGMPIVTKLRTIQIQVPKERPEVIRHTTKETVSRSAVIVTSAKFRNLGSIEKPQRIHYGQVAEFYTDL